MRTYLISYDLGLPENHSSYIELASRIKSFHPNWARPVKSVWIVKSDKNARQIRDQIKQGLDQNDKVIIVELKGSSWGTYNISKEVTDWLRKYNT